MTGVQQRLLSLGAMAVLVGGIGAYAYFGTFKGKKAEEEQKQKDEKLASFTLADVKAVSLVSKGTSYDIVGDGEGERKWRLLTPVETLAEKTVVEQLINHFVELKRKRVFDAKPEELKAYSLDPALYSVAFTTNDGAAVTYLVGKKNPFDDNVYVMRKGEGQVAMVPNGITYQVDRDLYALREKRVSIFDDKDVRKLEVEVKGKPTYVIEKKGDEWQLTAPIQAKADKAQMSSILSNLRNARGKAVVAEKVTDKELPVYGLDKPAAVVNLFLGDAMAKTRIVLGVAKPATADQFYARVDGQPAVLETAESLVKKVDLSVHDLRDRSVLSVERDAIKKIKLAEAGKDFLLLEKKKKDGDFAEAWDVIAPEQKPANDSKVSNVVFKLSTMKAKDIVTEAATAEQKKKLGLDNAARQITLSGADGAELVTLLIGNTDGDKVYAMVQGSARIDALDKAIFNEVSFDVKDYVKAETAQAPPVLDTMPQ